MAMILIAGPAIEPVSLAEAKAQVRVDGAAEDTLIASLITAARVHVETALSRALLSQSWTLLLDAWAAGRVVRLPLAPLRTVDEIRVLDADGEPAVVPAERYFVDAASTPPRILRKQGTAWPAPGQVGNGIEIDFTAGYGEAASDVPQPLRRAVLLLVAHWYETREPVRFDETAVVVPPGVGALLAPYRGARL